MKRFVTFVLLSVMVAALRAQSVTQAEAMQRASRYYNQHVRPAGLRSTAEAEPLSVTPWMAGDTTCMYAVQMAGGGWVLVSADDRTTASVLAYSENGIFDTGDMPDGMRWLLELYSEEILYIKDSTDYSDTDNEPRFCDQGLNTGGSAYYDPGNALLNTALGEIQWGQGYVKGDYDGIHCEKSYNYYCPAGKDGKCGKCPAGCGAVALGQLMRYWQWPPGAEVPTSITKTGKTSNNQWHYYDWNQMPVQLRTDTRSDSALAVARLLKDIGYAARTVYEADGSFTSADDLAHALQQYGYHATEHEKISGNWGDEIRAEINQGRPVIYGGARSSGGHWFVIDGYSESDPTKFHINWGWGNQQSDYEYYCTLSKLDPADGSGPYNNKIDFIMEIYPECSALKKIILGDASLETDILHLSYPRIESANQLKRGKYIFETDEMILLPGFSTEAGVELQILTPSYQYCNSYGPGKKNKKD